MSRINTNVSSMIAVNVLNKNNANLQTSLQRLSTGYRINSGKDDPAGLIASQSLLSEQKGTETAISNAQRADNIMSTADGALSEVGNLLVSLQGLVNSTANTAGLSQDEKDANQLQVDSILTTINRISSSASFEGTKLLNGNFSYTTSGLSTTSAFTAVSVNSAKVGSTALAVTVKVVTSAQTGHLNFQGTTSSLTGAATITVAGNKGSVQLAFASSTRSSSVVATINQFTDTTGVSATMSADNKTVLLASSGYGLTQYVSVTSNSTSFSTQDSNGVSTTNNYGSNAALTVNGVSATSDGLNVKAVADNLDASFTLSTAFNTKGLSKTFGITGGGATFSLGSQVNAANLASIGINTVDNAHLGKTLYTNKTGSTSILSLSDMGSGKTAAINSGDTVAAQNIVNQAVKDVAAMRGRLGAFQKNVIGSTINSLNVANENIASANSAIRDTDFATETANMTRSQILASSAITVLQQANSSPQSVLKLLG